MAESHLSPEKDLEICRVLTGWDALEKRLHGPTIIDFNLPGFSDSESENRYQDRLSVLEDLVRLQKDPEVVASPAVTQKLRAQEAFLRNVMGEHWPFKQYVAATMGFSPHSFTEQELQAQWKDVQNALSALGIDAGSEIWENLAALDQKIPENQIGEFYRDLAAGNAAALEPVIGRIPPFNFSVEFDDVDAYWVNWVDGGGTDYRLRFNRHHLSEHLKGSSALLAFHEISSHLVQAAILNRQIDGGEVPLCMGLTTVHGPEQFQSEGLAQSLTYFMDTAEAQDPFLVAHRELKLYSRMVENNLQIMINAGRSIEDCVNYGVEHQPYKAASDIAHSLVSVSNNPQFRVYQHVYGAANYFFKKTAEQLDDGQKRVFLKRIYNEWLSADELTAFRKNLLTPQAKLPTPGSPSP